MAKTNWTKEEIKAMLLRNPKAVERALIVLNELQTTDEKAIKQTRWDNNKGFNVPDAGILGTLANHLQNGGNLNEIQKELALSRVQKYAGQLARIANEKAKAQ
jgi:hypothetical protein